MKPVKMEITNFKGLKGKRTIRFYPLMAYCLPNAAGKTSLFDAFRWGLTGLEPEGGIVESRDAGWTSSGKTDPSPREGVLWKRGL